MIRGLALRSLCSMRIPNIIEYLLTPIRQGLRDKSGYVRKTAVQGVAKLYALDSEQVKKSDFVDILYSFIRDNDGMVVNNALYVLNEILKSEGGIIINKKIIYFLLNHMKKLNEWAQCVVLEFVAKYKPENDQEVFEIMNVLNNRLSHSNSGVVMATSKVFLNFTKHLPKVHNQVIERLKPSLLTLMGAGGPK